MRLFTCDKARDQIGNARKRHSALNVSAAAVSQGRGSRKAPPLTPFHERDICERIILERVSHFRFSGANSPAARAYEPEIASIEREHSVRLAHLATPQNQRVSVIFLVHL